MERMGTFTIVAVAFLSSAVAAESPPVTFKSPCECRDNHGEHRWAVKNDPSTPPADPSAKYKPSRLRGDSPGNETNSPVIRVYDNLGNAIETHGARNLFHVN